MTKEQFIIIIDEWDCLFREDKNNEALQKEYINLLRGLFKGTPSGAFLKLAYITGILPIKKYGTQSALNNFREHTMVSPRQMAEYVGFTETEVKAICREYDMPFKEMQRWYDGYYFERIGHVYSPNSADDVITLLIHMGYLAYDNKTKEVFIPNEEVRSVFLRAIKNDGWDEVIKAVNTSDALLRATLAMDERMVEKMIQDVHMQNTSSLAYNNEISLSSVIALAYYSACKDYVLIREMPTGNGFSDMVFLPKRTSSKPALILELKWDKTAEGAISQIKNKGYVSALKEYKGNILLVGINYEKKSKKHQCRIEKFEM